MEPTPLLDGLRFAECPRWHDDRLWFCDMHARRIMTVDEHGHAETVVQFARGVTPAGLGFLPDGSLLVVNLERPVILRRTVDGAVTEYADLTSLAVGPLNDLAVDRHGRAYVGSSGTDGSTSRSAPRRARALSSWSRRTAPRESSPVRSTRRTARS
ncbi:SMP-30/gluconolactonase/LRE family protein [Pseudonocardia sp. D17]|uniref:SMP-30/gluconolactonase/LRE family protein n=1 Tax=Pseudonocardia sp. D17 TaxID=882661 RepID=UPI0030D3EA0A|nr:hypothetical protein PSD17_41880 [Pseudonocardia sp. D17]